MAPHPPGPPPGFGPPGFGKKDKGKFDPLLCKALENAGLDTRDLIYCVTGDMDNDACYKDAWISFDKKGLYIAFGTQEMPKPENKFIRKIQKNKKRPEPKITVEKIISIPIEDIDSLKTERYTSTGRLLMTENGEEKSIVRFSISLIERFENLCRGFNSFKETGKADLPHDDEPKENKCKKCGAPCPPDKDFCRRHNKQSATAIRLMKFFGGHIPQMSIIILVMVMSSVVSAIIPQISTRTLYDDVLANPNGDPVNEVLKALAILVLSIFGIRALNMGMTMLQQYMSATIMPKVMYDIKVKIFEAMQRLSVGFYSSKQTGSLMDRVSRDATNIYWFFTDGLPKIIIDGATMVGVIVIMFMMSPKLSLVAFAALPMIIIILVVGDRLFRSKHHRLWVFRSKQDSILSDNINGQRVIKAFSKEDDEYDRFSSASDNVREAETDLALTEATLFPLLEIGITLLTTFVLGYGAIMVANGKSNMTAGTLLSFVVYLEMLREPFSFLAWVSNWWSRCADSASRVFEICDAKPDITEKENAIHLENIKGDIEINELEFEYEPARPVLKNMNLSVKSGDMLGIVGKTGAGKTTIANLISRLYDAKEGSVKIDGIDVRDLKLDDIHKNIGTVSQDIYLFYGSIADNIRYAKPDASMSEVIAAAKAACCHDFIMKLPDAYETRVGAGGQKLSGGERQRISIARTIIQNPKILILDEATAAMDTETERNIQRSLNELTQGRTTIAIAHRLSTLRDSNYLAVIDNGEIVEYGTYSELIKKKGEFYHLYKIQSEALKTIGIGEGDVHIDEDEEGEEKENGDK